MIYQQHDLKIGKPYLSLLLIVAIFLSSNSIQGQPKTYFQQKVNYKITVALDDKKHELDGNLSIDYTNNAPEALSFIYFHLWPNAYQEGTALAQQFIENGNTRMYYAPDSSLGGISDLNFMMNGKALSWEIDSKNPDIAIVRLPAPLKTGETVTISTPFRVKIPASFSRLGHVGESYQITQWYPKPAVYDQFGWHPMPYLNMGEFYSEFGDFDVEITLPKNYIVGATGELQTKSELQFLEQKVAATNLLIEADSFGGSSKFPPSSNELKTIRYTAKNVHDFAWFADKRFYVQQGEVALQSGKKVTTWAMFTYEQPSFWKHAVNFINRSVAYYSERIGEYPYPQATAVQSALSAGAGMEYPMITVIGSSSNLRSLDLVITHEVGHNWFYGILGSNERDYAWMDEGMNSYYENEYMEEYYGSSSIVEDMLPKSALRLLDAEKLDFEAFAYLYQARLNRHQPMNTPSQNLTMINYQLSAYSIPAKMFNYLENYLGREVFDAALQKYYKEWQFKHPYPKDLQTLLEQETGKDLAWFFDDFFSTKKLIDYSLKSMKTEGASVMLTVKNQGQIQSPVSISAMQGDSVLQTTWFDGFTGEKNLTIPMIPAATTYQIDGDNVILDFNPSNNRLKTPLKLKFLAGLENPSKKALYLTPTLGFNNYDGFMLGIGLYNALLPAKTFEFALTPLFGFGSSNIVGMGEIKGHILPTEGRFKRVTIGVSGRSFHYFENEEFDYKTRYSILKPYVEFELNRPERSPIQQIIAVNSRFLFEEKALFSPEGNFTGKTTRERSIFEAKYELKNTRTFNPYDVTFSIIGEGYEGSQGQNESYSRATLEANYKLNYARNTKKSFDIRLFTGAFLTNSNTDFGRFPLVLASQGYNDFYYENYYFGRSAAEGIWSQQVSLNNGGFKTPLPDAIQNGTSNSFLFALNLKADLPMKLPLNIPLKAYFDVGYFNETQPSVTDPVELFYNTGVMLDFGDGIFGIYFPVAGTESLMNQLASRGNYWNRISFSLDLTRLNVLKALRNIRIN